MKSNITRDEIISTYKRAIREGIVLPDEDTSVVFYDLSFLEERIRDLQTHFPENTLHAIAMKANPLFEILKLTRKTRVGSEVASLPELMMALEAGFDNNQIVFDSPCKTTAEIEFALKQNVRINADSFQELDRINSLYEKTNSCSSIGIRINPQIGTGSIQSTSVAGSISKFGVPLLSNRQKLQDAFKQYPWLTGVHVHIGSQGMPVKMLVLGIRRIMDFAEETNRLSLSLKGEKKIRIFDLGGGLAVSYKKEQDPVQMKEYSQQIKKEVPELFSGEYQLITEFGRYIHTNTAWAASRVEYVKRENDYNIIMSHLGADFMLRECYNPLDWHHHIEVLDSEGNIKDGKHKERYFIAGPLCFAGDIIGRDILLPRTQEGDTLIIHDVGGYTLSMWSRYNSRQVPKIAGYTDHHLHILKAREKPRDVSKFWR